MVERQISAMTHASPPCPAPSISVLIPAFNEEALIAKTIDSVRQSFAHAGHTGFEIIVCDNNSTDRTAEVARSKDARVVFEPHNQISRARNAAARHAVNDWLIFIDADTVLPPELLRSTIDTIATGTIAAGGTTVAFDHADIGRGAAAIVSFWNGISRFGRLAAGSYIFCRREAWSDTGGFNEAVYAGEELFFSQKLKRWGKSRGLGFRILTIPVLTSARKLQWYSPWELLWRTFSLARPGAMMRRENCGLWYSRPPENPSQRAET
jgi:glycosyltransferase involved in cell wall biosynthesis